MRSLRSVTRKVSRDLRSSIQPHGVAEDLRSSWQQTRSSFYARREAASGRSPWRATLGASSALVEVLFGAEPPMIDSAAPPRRFARLRRNWVAVMWLLTAIMFTVTIAWLDDNTTLWDPAVPIVGALLVLPLGLATKTPLRAWRLVVVLAAAAPIVLPPSSTTSPVDGPPWPPSLIFVALYTLYRLAIRANLRLLVPVAVVSSIVIWWSYIVADHRNASGSATATVIGVAVLLIFGYLIGTRRRMQDELAAGVRRTQQEQARSALLEERARIARELHDVVAHHMSVIAVRAETAPFRMPGMSEAVKDDMAETSAIAREALTEMRRLLGVLRGAGSGSELAPQPGLERLDGLIAGVRGAGLSVDVEIEGDVRALPPGVELSAFRIVQEALSNVLRHAPGAHATVKVSYEPDGLRVRVVNGPPPGGPTEPRPAGFGHGLIGMGERAAMLGGHLETGTTEEGGFMVEAMLPHDAHPHDAHLQDPRPESTHPEHVHPEQDADEQGAGSQDALTQDARPRDTQPHDTQPLNAQPHDLDALDDATAEGRRR
jgi:signal transduction histidine kinase